MAAATASRQPAGRPAGAPARRGRRASATHRKGQDRPAPVPGMRLTTAALVACLALAGCTDGGGDASPGGGTPAGDAGEDGLVDGDTRLQLPSWEVGQWWTLSSDQAAAPFTHVVAANGSADYTLATDSPDLAFFDARFDISFLGPVRKSDLAGSQGSTRVQFFEFPLTAGKSWSTTWDGLDIDINVTSVQGGLAKLEARHANGTLYAAYSFDGKTGYFRDYAFYGADGTTVGFAAKATASGKDFAGDLVRWQLQELYSFHGPMAGPVAQNFDIDPGATDVWIGVAIACSAGAVTLNVGASTGIQSERGVSANGPCPLQFSEQFAITAPMQQEAWGVQHAPAPPAATTATLDLDVLLRTLTTFAPGDGTA